MEYKCDSEVLAEIYRNAQLGLESISDILPEVEDEELRKEIVYQHDEYEKICGKACLIAKNNGIELKEPSGIKKAMMWSAIKMNAATDSGRQHIAGMMLKGTVTGITSLKTTFTDSQATLCDEIKKLLKEYISLEEHFERRLKEFL